MVPEANPLVDSCTAYVFVYALVLMNPPSQVGLLTLVLVVGLVDVKLIVLLGLVFVIITLLNDVMYVDVQAVDKTLNIKFILTVTPAGNGVGETVKVQLDVLDDDVPTLVTAPGVKTKLTLLT